MDAAQRLKLRETLSRSELLTFFSQRPRAVVAMESGSGAHHWARSLRAMGHEPRIIDPRFVARYRRQGTAGKNDTNDAEAICAAAGRPRMRFVPIKTADQQAQVLVHRIRASVVTDHTRTINQLRGLLAEFGIVVPQGADGFKRLWPKIRQRYAEQLPALAWASLDELYAELGVCTNAFSTSIGVSKPFVREDEAANRLAEVPGIGVITASAIVRAWAAPVTSRTAGSSPPGWAWCHDSPAPAASPGWGASPNGVTATCAPCWFTERAAK
ncbi:MAG: IS110 family transposase [Pseudomonadota bacterium]